MRDASARRIHPDCDSQVACRRARPAASAFGEDPAGITPSAVRCVRNPAFARRARAGEALALAQKIGGKAFELRGTTSPTRLVASQGRRDEARTMLAEIYNWFTEGFDTADLKDAKALLDELSA
jgi:hypothetical protein